MKTRVGLLLLAGAVSGFGQYAWDSQNTWFNTVSSQWSQNGTPGFTHTATVPYTFFLSFQATGGSLIWLPAMSGSNSNDYEVASTLGLPNGGGTYIHFLRADSATVQAGSGSYVSAEITMPATIPGTGTLVVNQCTQGSVMQLGSASVAVNDGMKVRTVIFGVLRPLVVRG